MDTPIGQFVLIGNFRRRLARELLVGLEGRLLAMERDCGGISPQVNGETFL